MVHPLSSRQSPSISVTDDERSCSVRRFLMRILEKNWKKAISLFLFGVTVPHIHESHKSIYDNCGSFPDLWMRDPYTEKCPEEYPRDDIGSITTLEPGNEKQEGAEWRDCIGDIPRTSERISDEANPYCDIERCRHDNPCNSDFDTRSDDDMSLSCMEESISEKSEDREHHDECRPDPDIPPGEEPCSCQSYS